MEEEKEVSILSKEDAKKLWDELCQTFEKVESIVNIIDANKSETQQKFKEWFFKDFSTATFFAKRLFDTEYFISENIEKPNTDEGVVIDKSEPNKLNINISETVGVKEKQK